MIFVANPNYGDYNNLNYNKETKIVINYNKGGLNILPKNNENKEINSVIDFGLIFLIKKDIEKFIINNNKTYLDMGDIYLWLIKEDLLKVCFTCSKYIDIGTYKGWSLLSTKLAN